MDALRGHFMTLGPFLGRALRPPPRPQTQAFEVTCEDPDIGPVRLTGRLLWTGSKDLIVVQHGLGGSTQSGYMALVLRAASEAGRSCLLLNSRGADRSGADVYHSGLTADLRAALGHPRFSEIEHIDLFGYSIGGHILLRYCTEDVDPRIRRVAAIGSPLDLRAASDDFDALRIGVYRSHVLDSLKEIYTTAFQRNPRGILPERARKIQSIRVWDEEVIAPRFGFKSADDYYASESVAGRISELKVPALYVGAAHDPMILARSVWPHLVPGAITTHFDPRAGHLGFGSDFDLGMTAPLGLEAQVLAWLSRS